MTPVFPLAAWACDPARSRGRRYPVTPDPTRSSYQRDRDRIVHSSAFRRLEYKTQVFVNHEGDLFRTRLTHTLEVAQLGRSIARALALNEDLVEAICLAHDLGHTPFGHAGQEALNDCMRAWGGFEHNLQSLRLVDFLEQRYPAYDGLNLSFEAREGILKHCSRRNAELLEAREPGGVGARFLRGEQPSLEAQLCNLVDAIAYSAHDVDDGVRSHLLTLDQLREVPLVARYLAQVVAEYPRLARPEGARRLRHETIRRMLSGQVHDVITTTRDAVERARPADVDAVRRLPPLVAFSAAMGEGTQQLQQFLLRNLYRHPQVARTMEAAQQVVRELFTLYREDATRMPADQAAQAFTADDEAQRMRSIADFIAGMTDRYALREHERLTGRRLLP
ncbi:MAG: deoxyguanosinetriphosphate triphosphohydrolase [Comamonadaceae bacterium]|nr:deoxyguanosinetriphosphate triphosphohydrolase [Burkholderiales bacterium]MEB2349062.1 deoxyguanosinetriphosphate triphosphohydrolase [Comamonadaceae bacterium]